MRNHTRCGLVTLAVVLLIGCVAGSTAAAPLSTPTSVSRTPVLLPEVRPDPSARPVPVVGRTNVHPLPLNFPTGSATQVVTVVATDTHATTAVLQMWDKAVGGWVLVGSAVTADVGKNGLSAQVTEGAKATPIGSFTLTQAFGRNGDPGTALPYFQTTPDDWWISEPGALYNTHQHCSSGCAFNTASTGNPNEHLYYETPYYDYAVVIDYNTANAGPIVQGVGSAFFLHVTVGKPTLGCVAVPVDALLPLMRWLNPADQPRILIGTTG